MKSVAVIPVRRSVFDDKLKCKYRTFPGSVSDDVVKVMREGESGKNQMEMQKLIGEPDWGSGVIEWENGEEIADIQIDIKNQHFEGTEKMLKFLNLYWQFMEKSSINFSEIFPGSETDLIPRKLIHFFLKFQIRGMS